jgi:hypothetical protein
MARLFTAPFHYKEQTYTAVISLTHCNGNHTVTIHLPDESLHPILGKDTVSFDADKGLPIDSPAITPAQELLICILIAVEQKDQKWKESTNNHQVL